MYLKYFVIGARDRGRGFIAQDDAVRHAMRRKSRRIFRIGDELKFGILGQEPPDPPKGKGSVFTTAADVQSSLDALSKASADMMWVGLTAGSFSQAHPQMLRDGLALVEGGRFAGFPITDMSRSELLAVVGIIGKNMTTADLRFVDSKEER